MPEMLAALSNIRTVEEMIAAFRDEQHCRRLLESMVWPDGRICPACGYKRSIALAGRDTGKRRARPGLYQCSSGDCRFQFTVTTHTPLHSTKLPLRVWLKAMWLLLQSDKGLSSVRLAEALGVSQPTAWRMGHALRLMVARENMLAGTVEIDHFHLGGRPRKNPDDPPPGRGRKGQANTDKTPVMAMVRRPTDVMPGTLAGDARAAVVTGLSARASERVIEAQIELGAHLMSDEWKAFMAIGESFAKHETVKHSSGEYVRDAVHVIRWRASTPASAVPSPASFIISARSMPTCISTRSASDGRSASSQETSFAKPGMAGRACEPCGRACRLRCN